MRDTEYVGRAKTIWRKCALYATLLFATGALLGAATPGCSSKELKAHITVFHLNGAAHVSDAVAAIGESDEDAWNNYQAGSVVELTGGDLAKTYPPMASLSGSGSRRSGMTSVVVIIAYDDGTGNPANAATCPTANPTQCSVLRQSVKWDDDDNIGIGFSTDRRCEGRLCPVGFTCEAGGCVSDHGSCTAEGDCAGCMGCTPLIVRCALDAEQSAPQWRPDDCPDAGGDAACMVGSCYANPGPRENVPANSCVCSDGKGNGALCTLPDEAIPGCLSAYQGGDGSCLCQCDLADAY